MPPRSAPQPALPGMDAPVRPQHRLFFALYPDAATAARLAAYAGRLQADLQLKGRPLAPERLHVTLQYLGDHVELGSDLIACAVAAGDRMQAKPLTVRFDRLTSFAKAGRRPWVLTAPPAGLQALMSFQHRLTDALRQAGWAGALPAHYTPHLTLLYDRRAAPQELVPPISFTVREFALMDSLIGQSTHLPLARWPLA